MKLEINSLSLYLLFSSIAILLLQFIATPGLIGNVLATIGISGRDVIDGKIDSEEMEKRVKKSTDAIIHAFRLLTGLSLVKLTVALYILLK